MPYNVKKLSHMIFLRRLKMKDLALAISSIKIQSFIDIYPMKQAFDIGTIFKQLNKPWVKYHE